MSCGAQKERNLKSCLPPPPQKKIGGCSSESLYNLHTLSVQVTYSLTLYECHYSLISVCANSATYQLSKKYPAIFFPAVSDGGGGAERSGRRGIHAQA